MVLVAGCGEPLSRTSLVASPETSPDVRRACAVTEQKCTRCHTLGRVLAADATTRDQWEPIVLRMRRMASSGISSNDADVVLHCLASRR
ncbi:MAG TPA: hypothetical protein VMZ53_20620 [Kofleriaceae bacterium]|nr:hypothetical protein [Kofleriaceae bacterium]